MARDRHNILEYVRTQLEGFREAPFSEVDSLVLSKLSYLHWQGVADVPARFGSKRPPRLADLYRAEDFPTLYDTVLDHDLDELLFAAIAASPRFRDVIVLNHVDTVDEEHDKQFSATTFALPDHTTYVAFRGTDNTIVGWKEDFNLAFVSPVASQRSARAYLDRAASHTTGRLRVGGHSKGGNLAVYAAARCHAETRARIVQVFSHDGPGFNERTLQSVEFSGIEGLVSKSVPESSIVGMLLEHQEAHHVIKSDAMGIIQHDPYSWIVVDGAFVPAEQLSGSADYVNTTLSDWIGGMDDEQMERFTNALFAVFDASGTKRFQDMTTADHLASVAALFEMDPDERKMFFQTVSDLAAAGARTLTTPHDDEAVGAGETSVATQGLLPTEGMTSRAGEAISQGLAQLRQKAEEARSSS